MKNKRVLGFVLALGLLLTLSMLGSMAAAQGANTVESPQTRVAPAAQTPPDRVQGFGRELWPVLDPAQPEDEVWPELRRDLFRLKRAGRILDFDPQPQRSAPDAVAAALVVARPGAYEHLLGLPGVLDVTAGPPPPSSVEGEPGVLGALGASGTISGLITGTLGGLVTDAGTGGPIPNAPVQVYDAVSFAYLAATTADASGRYTLTVTSPYSRAKVYAAPSDYLPGWYGDALYFRDAGVITPTSGPRTDVDLALGKGGTLSVTLSQYGGGAPPDNINLAMYDAHSGAPWGTSSQVGPGQYVVRYLPTGLYVVEFSGGDFPGIQDSDYYGVIVTESMTTELSTQVDVFGVIRGTVTEEGTGTPLNWAYVEIDEVDGYWYDYAFTEPPSGTYQTVVPSGTYVIRYSASEYNDEWYDDKDPATEEPDLVTVTAGSTVVANAALAQAVAGPQGTISGTITKNGGAPLDVGDRVYVYAYGPDYYSEGLYGNGVQTEYTMTVVAGLYGYEVEFHGVVDGKDVGTYYADPVTVTANTTTPNINFDTLDSIYGYISGTITKNGGDPLDASDYVYVSAEGYDYDSTTLSGDGARTEYGLSVWADSGSPTYTVQFEGTVDGKPVFAYYEGKADEYDADPVVVIRRETTADINFDTQQSAYGCISGTLTNNDAPGGSIQLPVEGNVQVHAWQGGDVAGSDSYVAPSDNGVYEMCGLMGDHTVSFAQYPWATTWYSDAVQPAADFVTVVGPHTTANIDLALDDLGSCVSGQVVYAPQPDSETFYSLYAAGVSIYDASGNEVLATYAGRFGSSFSTYGSASTDKDGGFVICGLSPGTYAAHASGSLFGDDKGERSVLFTVGRGASVDVGQIVLGQYIVHLPLMGRNWSGSEPQVQALFGPLPAISPHPAGQQGETFYTTTVTLNVGSLPAGGAFYLSSSGDQAASILVDDQLVLVQAGTEIFSHAFSDGISLTPAVIELPRSIVEVMAQGKVVLEYRDVYGTGVSATELWLIWVP